MFRSRALSILLATCIAVSSCAEPNDSVPASRSSDVSTDGGPETPSEPAGSVLDPASVDVGTGPIAALTTPVAAGPDVAARAVAAGFDEATAELLALTESTVEVVDVHTFVVRHVFPTGATADVTYQLVAGTGMNPSDPPGVTGEFVDDEFRFAMSYAISAADLPADLRAQVGDALPAQPSGFRSNVTPSGLRRSTATPIDAGALRPVSGGESPDVVGVVVTAEISQGVEEVGGKFVEHLEGKGYTKAGTSWEAFKAGKKIMEALDANETLAKAIQELATIRKCAENPTNPLTQKQYRDDPQERQKALDRLAAAEIDIKVNAAVIFTTMLADTAGGLAKAVPWLGFITAPANSYVQETLTSAVKFRLDEARKGVVPCTPTTYLVDSMWGEFALSGTICDVGRPFRLDAISSAGSLIMNFTWTGETAGSIEFAGNVEEADITGTGSFVVGLDGESGTLSIETNGTGTMEGFAVPSFVDSSTFPIQAGGKCEEQ